MDVLNYATMAYEGSVKCFFRVGIDEVVSYLNEGIMKPHTLTFVICGDTVDEVCIRVWYRHGNEEKIAFTRFFCLTHEDMLIIRNKFFEE